jgi:hypothetical protein
MYQVRLPSLKGVRSRPLHSWPELASPPLPVLDGSPLGGLMSSSIDGHWPLVVSLRPAALSYSSRRQVSGWRTDSDRVRADGCKLRDRAHPSTSLCLLMTIARGRHQRGARGIWGELGHAAGPRAAGWICRMPRSSYRLVAGLAPSYRACSGPPCSSLSLKTRDMPTGDRGQATRPWRMTIIAQAWHGPSSS